MTGEIFRHPTVAGYRLVDSGDGEKLESFGAVTLRRPDPQALWRRAIPGAWSGADLRFVRESDRGGHWEPRGEARRPPAEWLLGLGVAGLPAGVRVTIRPTPFKHVGLFPEQATNWLWVESRRLALAAAGVPRPRLLNLFAYTGAASLFAAAAGWEVTHVDASKSTLDWAAANLRASALPSGAIRWMAEDASRFCAREQRRGRSYHGVLLDPPHYGRGPKGEKWQFESDLAPLLERCKALLAADCPSFLVLSAYAIGYSPLAFENLLREYGDGRVESGELALPDDGGRLLPCGFCARWTRT